MAPLACCPPCFTWNSMTWTCDTTRPSFPCLMMSSRRASSLSLKTREMRSKRVSGLSCSLAVLTISGHLGLQVNVMKRSGLPCFLTKAMASWYSCCMCLLPPVKEEGRTTRRPTSLPSGAAPGGARSRMSFTV